MSACITPRRHPVWWDACAFCPDGGNANRLQPSEQTVTVLYGRRLRRAHLLCLPMALAAGADVWKEPPVVVRPMRPLSDRRRAPIGMPGG